MAVIPFYGASDRDLFAIERRAMDRAGLVVDHLDRLLPPGLVLDVGAGDGFTALRLRRPDREVVALEPAAGVLDAAARLRWVRGEAEALPFADDTFDAVYATWAYFFPTFHDPSPGLLEAERVLVAGGLLVVVDNLGGDEFSALADTDLATDADWWAQRGFGVEVVETAFEFDDEDEARRLLGRYFGDRGRAGARRRLGYRVGVFSRRV